MNIQSKAHYKTHMCHSVGICLSECSAVYISDFPKKKSSVLHSCSVHYLLVFVLQCPGSLSISARCPRHEVIFGVLGGKVSTKVPVNCVYGNVLKVFSSLLYIQFHVPYLL